VTRPKPTASRALGRLPRSVLAVAVLWVVSAFALAEVSGRVRDWFDMTDEMRYERLAISIAQTHSLIPRVHGVDIRSFSQLYPLLLAPIFGRGYVPGDVVVAHVFNACLMTSACIPAYLLARRTLGRTRLAYAAAALSVCLPWMLYAAMLLTEVAAYPVFLWTALAMQNALTRPAARNDVLAVAALAAAYFARAELIVLVVVLPIGLAAYELGEVRGGLPHRIAAASRRSVTAHKALFALYLGLAAGAAWLVAIGRFSTVFGVYGGYASADQLFPHGTLGSFAEHVATFSLGLGILPVLAGSAWLLANLVRPPENRELRAFACLGSVTAFAILAQATNFDVRYTGFVHDRFLVYVAPIVLLATFCALRDRRTPRLALLVPTAVVALGFGYGAIPMFTWSGPIPALLPDAPVSGLYRPLVDGLHSLHAVRILLIVATVLLACLFAAGSRLLRRQRLTTVVTLALALGCAVPTVYLFAYFLTTQGTSNRPLTASEASQDWVDRAVGRKAAVAIVPSQVSSSFLTNEEAWRDVEFWNEAVDHDVRDPTSADFESTGIWFPKTYLSFDARTGRVDVSPDPYAVVSNQDTRFGLAGTALVDQGAMILLHVASPWRLDWLSFGLWDDGWTKPGVTARVRVYSEPGQRSAVLRTVTLQALLPPGVASRPVRIASNVSHFNEVVMPAGLVQAIQVCVPKRGFATITLSSPVSSAIPGNVANGETLVAPRRGGVLFDEVALAGELGGRCRP